MNLYKLHSNPDELIGYTDRDWYFDDEAEELILQGKEVTKPVIGDLNLGDTPITSLPDNLTVQGILDIEGTKITSLPDNLRVGGDLYLHYTKITSLPDNLRVGGDLNLRDTPNLDKDNLPSSLVVKGKIIY
jgi:hypothetical protein